MRDKGNRLEPKMSDGSRVYTKEETREMFLAELEDKVTYWRNLKTPATDPFDGLLHSILCVIDGVAGLPSFDITVRPHSDDKKFHEDEGENYFEDGLVINDDVYLHDLLYKKS